MLTSSSSIRRRASARMCSMASTRPSSPRSARNSMRSVPTLRPGQRHAPHLGELFVGQHRARQLEPAAIARARIEQVAFRAQPHVRRGDDLLADAVDGRVGDLREQLLEVVVQHARLLRERRQRRVVAHGADAFVAVARHRRHEDALVFEGVAERHLALGERHGLRRAAVSGAAGRSLRCTRCCFSQSAYGRSLMICCLDLLVFDDAAQLGVHQEHAARLQPALAHDLLGREVEHAGFATP